MKKERILDFFSSLGNLKMDLITRYACVLGPGIFLVFVSWKTWNFHSLSGTKILYSCTLQLYNAYTGSHPFVICINKVYPVLFLACSVFFAQDMGHLPETKVEKFLHEPANIGRSVHQGEYTSIPSSAEAVSVPSPPSQRRTTPYG